MQSGQTQAVGDSDFQLRGEDKTSLVLGIWSQLVNPALGQSGPEFGILIFSVPRMLSDSHSFLS